jgi:nitroreductase
LELNESAQQPSLSAIDPRMADVIRGRRTIGTFRPELPSREIVLAAIDVARWAPNHKKTEPWHVVWLGPETKQAVIELNARLVAQSKGPSEAESKRRKWAEVPGWLVVTCDLADNPLRRDEDYAACCCLVQNLMLSLWSAGIGTKWATGDVIRQAEFLELLGLDSKKQRAVGLIWYGYPAVTPGQTRSEVESFLIELP